MAQSEMGSRMQNLPILHLDHTAGRRSRIGIVCNHHNGLTELDIQFAEHLQHFAGVVRIKAARRLIGQNDRRPVDDRARNRYALLFAAGELRRPEIGSFR